MADNKEFSMSFWLVGGLVVAAMIGAIAALVFMPAASPWQLAATADIFRHLRATSAVPNWGLYILVLLAMLGFAPRLATALKRRGPKISDYREDTFEGLKWRWVYQSGRPVNAWAYCPHCDTQLVYAEMGGRFTPVTVLNCETCNLDILHHDGSKDYLVKKIDRLIDRKIRTGVWRQAHNARLEQPA